MVNIFFKLMLVSFLLFVGLMGIVVKGAEIREVDPCKVLVIITDDGEVVIREPSSLDYKYCVIKIKKNKSLKSKIFGGGCNR